jgi:integrase
MVEFRNSEAGLMTKRWERGLKISGWTSAYSSVNRLLIHLKRRTCSEASKELYCYHLYRFCCFVSAKQEKNFVNPDNIVMLSKQDIESLGQAFCDEKLDVLSRRTVVTQRNVLLTFFKVNGFKGERELDIESYSLSGFGRKKPEYIPTLTEVLKMANVAGNLRNRAIILLLLSSGFRVSTLCAILFGDIKEELEKRVEKLYIEVHERMKQIVPNAAKGRRAYPAFTFAECTEAIRLYIKDRIHRRGKIDDTEPLFIPELGRLRRNKRVIRPLTSREVQLIVKEAARKAGIIKWRDVTPHCIRKTFSTWVLCAPLVDGSRLDVKTQEIFMGHVLPGSQDVYYDRTKIEALRKEHWKLSFTPRVEGRLEPFEILRLLSNEFDVDFIGLLESKKERMQRNLMVGEQLGLIKEILERIKATLRKPSCISENYLRGCDPSETEEISKKPKELGQTFFLPRFEQPEKKIDQQRQIPQSLHREPETYSNECLKSKKSGQTDLQSFC